MNRGGSQNNRADWPLLRRVEHDRAARKRPRRPPACSGGSRTSSGAACPPAPRGLRRARPPAPIGLRNASSCAILNPQSRIARAARPPPVPSSPSRAPSFRAQRGILPWARRRAETHGPPARYLPRHRNPAPTYRIALPFFWLLASGFCLLASCFWLFASCFWLLASPFWLLFLQSSAQLLFNSALDFGKHQRAADFLGSESLRYLLPGSRNCGRRVPARTKGARNGERPGKSRQTA